MKKVVISLCDTTGIMVQPWANAGYTCLCFDLKNNNTYKDNIHRIKWDLSKNPSNLTSFLKASKFKPIIGFAFPPCTDLAISGSSHFKSKGLNKLWKALRLVDHCKTILESYNIPYMLENPVSTISSYWRKPNFIFHPCDYDYYTQDNNNYTKKTCLWTSNHFPLPKKIKSKNPDKQRILNTLGKGEKRQSERNKTPSGFANAVYDAYHNPTKHGRFF